MENITFDRWQHHSGINAILGDETYHGIRRRHTFRNKQRWTTNVFVFKRQQAADWRQQVRMIAIRQIAYAPVKSIWHKCFVLQCDIDLSSTSTMHEMRVESESSRPTLHLFQADLAVCRCASLRRCRWRCLSVKSTNRWCVTSRIRRTRRRWCVKDSEVSPSSSSSSSIKDLASAKHRVPLHHLYTGD